MYSIELMKKRHSVRQYLNEPIDNDKKEVLNKIIEDINLKQNTHIQIVYDEPTAFNSFMAHYGKFENVTNYIALVGKDEEKLGYYGEEIVLKAQEIGLNTCFVALSYNKNKAKSKISILQNEKLFCVIAIGKGKNHGMPHHSKKREDVLQLVGEKPSWLDDAITACLLAPTALNQQKFIISCNNGDVDVKIKGVGPYTTLDLGIVKFHLDCIKKANNQ
ncbi:MAG: nitroreductase [Erysipelotrichaceae bacterium]|nr:nitroreductase [Erysipelotrichaceae bacterium]